MEYYNSEFAKITYLEDINTVELAWKKQVSSAGYREAFQKGLDALRHFNSTSWLSDTTHQGVISPDDRKWMETNILPLGIKRGLCNIAAVLPRDVFKKHYVDSLKRKVEMEHLTIHYFGNATDAKAWFREILQAKQSA